MRRSPLPPRKKRPRSRRRTVVERDRIYGTAEHITWMKSLPCHFCGVVGYSVEAHVRNGGMSRKADAEFTLPACGPHRILGRGAWLVGCHRVFDDHKKSWRAMYRTDEAAAHYAAQWLEVSGRVPFPE